MGQLTKTGTQSVGQQPMGLAFNPSGRWLAVACKNANKVEFYNCDRESGLLRAQKDLSITIDQPACLLWTE